MRQRSNPPLVSLRLWNITRVLLFAVMLIGLGLVALLKNGAADPTTDFPVGYSDFAATPPLTLITTDAAFDLVCGDSTLHILVRRDGYFSVSPGEPDWQEFMHITREQNRLYWHIDTDGHAVFRINDEIAWEGSLPFAGFGCAFHREEAPRQ